MTSIRRLHWDEIPPGPNRAWAPMDGRVFGVWPAPTNSDACFAEAGFLDFDGYDGSDEWDAEFDGLTAALLGRLERAAGTAVLREGAHVRRASWGRRQEPRTARVALAEAARDDSQPDCLVDVGSGPAACLRTAHGHLIWWIWLSTALAVELPDLLGEVGGGRPIERTTLRWNHPL